MQRRAVLTFGLAALAGCAGVTPPRPEGAGVTPTTASIPPPSTPPPPPPPAPPDNPAFLAGPEPMLTTSGDPEFDAWRLRLMENWGASWRPYLLRLFDGLRPIQVSPERPNPPEEAAAVFVREVVTPARIAEGRRRAAEPWLQAIAKARGVPAAVLAAVWSAESDFGRTRGEHDLLAFWATRAAVGDQFRDDQFAEAARLVVAGAVPRSALRAFPDGSTGQVRWFPTQYAAMGVDGDGDGFADIWRSAPDAVASVAARLSGGWEPGSWLAEVMLPSGADPRTQRLLQALHREASIRPDYVRRADGQPWSEADRAGSGKLIQTDGARGPAYLALRNFTPLQYLAGDYRGRYTDETLSAAWALAIGLLANHIAAAA